MDVLIEIFLFKKVSLFFFQKNVNLKNYLELLKMFFWPKLTKLEDKEKYKYYFE